MITKISSENYGQYKVLFDEASTVVGYDIPDLDAYMANIPTLREQWENNTAEHPYDHHFTILPLDEPPFHINANSRQIEIPSDFKKNGLAVIGDHLAEIVYFSIDRYYDTWDLLGEGMKAVVQWSYVSAGKALASGISPITEIDATVFVKDRKVLFGWPIDNTITKSAGTIKFSVRFYKIVELQGENHLVFSMNTIPTSLEVKAGLNFMSDDGAFSVETSDITNVFEQRFSKGFGYVNADGADVPEWIIPLSLYDGDIEEIQFENSSTPAIFDLIPQDDAEHPYKLTIGVNAWGNGKITYSVHSTKEGFTSIPAYPVYFPTEDTEASGTKVYYRYTNGSENPPEEVSGLHPGDSLVPTQEEIDAVTQLDPETGDPVLDPETNEPVLTEDLTYYEAIWCYDIESTGTYWLKANNFVEPASNKYLDSGRVEIPKPAKPEAIANGHVFLTEVEENNETVLKLLIPMSGHSEQEGDKLNYNISGFTWEETPQAVFRSIENLENDAEYTFDFGAITGEADGDYTVNKYDVEFFATATATRNGDSENSESVTIRVTHAPEAPVLTTSGNQGAPGDTIGVSITNLEEINSDEIIYTWCKVTADEEDDETINPNTGLPYGNTAELVTPLDLTGRYYCIVTNKLNGGEAFTQSDYIFISA